MGNMKFKQRPREEQAEADESEPDEPKFAAEMYGVDTELMLNALIKPRVRVGTEWYQSSEEVESNLFVQGSRKVRMLIKLTGLSVLL